MTKKAKYHLEKWQMTEVRVHVKISHLRLLGRVVLPLWWRQTDTHQVIFLQFFRYNDVNLWSAKTWHDCSPDSTLMWFSYFTHFNWKRTPEEFVLTTSQVRVVVFTPKKREWNHDAGAKHPNLLLWSIIKLGKKRMSTGTTAIAEDILACIAQ